MFFSQRLKELRVEKNLTQKELSLYLGLSPNSICEWEKGRCEPNAETLKKLSELFECSIDYLLGHSDDFGNINIYHETDNLNSLSADEQRMIDLIRKNPPHNATDWITLYAELPTYMQESIFAELKGMHLGYKAATAKKSKGKKL